MKFVFFLSVFMGLLKYFYHGSTPHEAIEFFLFWMIVGWIVLMMGGLAKIVEHYADKCEKEDDQ